MQMRARVLGGVTALLATVLGVGGVTSVAEPAAAVALSATTAPAPVDFRCVMEPYGQTRAGRIVFRRVVNDRVTESKSTSGPVTWRPVSWALVSLNRVPGSETSRQLVASTDGRVRLVETSWGSGPRLSVRLVDVARRRFPARLVTLTGSTIYWVADDGSLHRATWNGSRVVREFTLPVVVRHARAITSEVTNRGTRLYYTDRAGALHVVADEGASSTDVVLRSSGYAEVTGLRSGGCYSPSYARMRPFIALLLVDRTTGVARYQRITSPAAADGGVLTKPRRVRPADWTWRRLG